MSAPVQIVIDTILLRGGTAEEWVTKNPVLESREPGVETDTGKLKIGDGVTAWVDLPYLGGDSTPLVITTGAAAPTDSTPGNLYLRIGA